MHGGALWWQAGRCPHNAPPPFLQETFMFSHLFIGSNDLERSRRFYDALLAVLGAPAGVLNEAPSGHQRLFYRHAGGVLGVSQPIDGEPATPANGGTVGFKCESPEQVQAFHDMAVAQGGQAIEQPPGLRQGPSGALYLAYVRDPDGNKLCAMYRVKAA
jgi:catechol 2,3-dioxygenase-like lactoylglutathione lyase family enzyme